MNDVIETIGAGHNSGTDVSEGAFLADLAAHSDLDFKIKNLMDLRKKLRKEMRAKGVRLTEFDTARKFANMKRDDVQDHFVHLAEYMRWMRHPIGTQFNLDLPSDQEGDFEDDDVILARSIENAVQDGFMAGLSNKDMNENPHDTGSDIGQKWIEAWHDGQKRRGHESIDPHDND